MIKNYKNEYRVFGPPGTGKTTYLQKQISRALNTHKPDSIYVCSFSKAAAVNLVDRGLNIPRENIGTIHALCYRLLGSPAIAESKIKLFNETEKQPISNQPINIDDPFSTLKEDDTEILNSVNFLRNQLKPITTWSQADIYFFDRWKKFKSDNDLMDFTDLLEQGLEHELKDAEIIFVDEAQDLVPLTWKVVRSWAENCEKLILAGDDDQTLYEWAGASAKLFIPPPDFPQDHIIPLKQSYRVPKLIHRIAEDITERMLERFQDKEYKPRDHKGVVRHLQRGNFQEPNHIAAEIAEFLKQNRTKSAMLLASCGYILAPTLKQLRELGVPYANNYRPNRGDWNPLQITEIGSKKTSTLTRFSCFAVDMQYGARWGSIQRIKNWHQMIKKTNRKYSDEQFSSLITTLSGAYDSGHQFDDDFIRELLPETVAEVVISRDLNNFIQLCYKKYHTLLDYYANIYMNGFFIEVENPRLTVGTIHSVKGGEADCVFLYPDLSPKSILAVSQGDEDAVHRMMYVGVTRTQDELVFLPRKNKNSYKF